MKQLKRWLRTTPVGPPLKRAKRHLCDTGIRLTQAAVLRSISRDASRLVIFLTPGTDRPAGGVMSIVSLCTESAELTQIHSAQVLLCTVPGDPPFLKYRWFRNRALILNLDSLIKRCRSLDFLLLHIPEYAVNRVNSWLESNGREWIRHIGVLHLNVLLQNIDMVAEQDVAGLTRFGKVTCTTGHEAYSTERTRASLGVPLHKLSVRANYEQYHLTPYERKSPLLVVSPDEHPAKERILRRIASALPGLRIQEIKDLSYEQYKRLIARAKWALTFGEGLDGYYGEPIFSGSVGFAVYNDRFFTAEYAGLENVYPSWEALEQRLVGDLQRLDEPDAYRRCWRAAYELLVRKYNNEEYRDNLRRFYLGQYTYP